MEPLLPTSKFQPFGASFWDEYHIVNEVHRLFVDRSTAVHTVPNDPVLMNVIDAKFASLAKKSWSLLHTLDRNR